MCTHLHVDHVGWNTRLENGRWVPTFPKARYVFSETEYKHWAGEHAKTPVPPFGDSVLPIVEAKRAELVRDDHELGDHVRLMPTPGHTPGHVAIAFGRGRDDAVMPGDLMHSPLQARYPELSARFDTDMAQAAKTRRSFLERYCDTKTLCCTAHFPSPSAGRIKRWDDGFRCEPVEGWDALGRCPRLWMIRHFGALSPSPASEAFAKKAVMAARKGRASRARLCIRKHDAKRRALAAIHFSFRSRAKPFEVLPAKDCMPGSLFCY